jgi:hypothetical protein
MPIDVFKLPGLVTFAATKNCMSSEVLDVLCEDSKNLEEFVIEGIGGSSACNGKLVAATIVSDKGVSGTLPKCIFSMPRLRTLYVSGNNLKDSLEDVTNISRSLQKAHFSHNSITGTLPRAFQEHNWSSLDLSFNRIAGYLHSDLAPANGSSWRLRVNRLSGDVPAGMQHMENIDILAGNMYSCKNDHSDLPENDPAIDQYSCGSEEFNYTAYMWISSMGIFIICMVCTLAYYKHDIYTGLKTFAYEGAFKISDVAEGNLFSGTMFWLRVQCGLPLLGCLFALLFLYLILHVHFSLYTHKYAWILSAGYISGLVPGSLCLIAWVGVFWAVWYVLKIQLTREHIHHRNTVAKSRVFSAHSSAQKFADSTGDVNSSKSWSNSAGFTSTPPSIPLQYKLFLLFAGLGNLVLVTLVNVAYVVAYLKGNKTETIISEMALSIFKVMWNNFAVNIMLDYAHKKFLADVTVDGVQVLTYATIFRNLVIFGNMVTFPCIAFSLVSPQCFYNLFIPPHATTSSYDFDQCVEYDPTTITADTFNWDCIEYKTVTRTISYVPSFSYSYECSSGLITAFSPVYMFTGIIVSFMLPGVAYLASKFLPDRVENNDTSLLIRLVNMVSSPLDNVTAEDFAKNIHVWLHLESYLGKIMGQMAVCLTFGKHLYI